MKKLIRKIGIILFAMLSYSLTSSNASAVELTAHFANLVYNGDGSTGTYEFDVFLKPGTGYIVGDSTFGKFSTMNLYYRIYPEAGVTFELGYIDVVDVIPDTEHFTWISLNSSVGPYGIYGLPINRVIDEVDLIEDTYIRIATVKIPVTGQPTSATYLVISERDVTDNPTSAWSSPKLSGHIVRPGAPIYHLTVTGDDYITVSGAGTPICSGTSVTLSASLTTAGSVNTPIFRWYDAPTGGTLLETGPTFTPSPNLAETTTFYVSVSGDDVIEGARKAVAVTVIPLSTPSMIKVTAQ